MLDGVCDGLGGWTALGFQRKALQIKDAEAGDWRYDYSVQIVTSSICSAQTRVELTFRPQNSGCSSTCLNIFKSLCLLLIAGNCTEFSAPSQNLLRLKGNWSQAICLQVPSRLYAAIGPSDPSITGGVFECQDMALIRHVNPDAIWKDRRP